MTVEYLWPKVFETLDFTGICDAALCADGIAGWNNCILGARPIPFFGRTISTIAFKLGISGSLESFKEKAKEYTSETTQAQVEGLERIAA